MKSLCVWLLLAATGLGISMPEAQPSYKTLSARGKHYGSSAGFKQADIKDYPFLASLTYEFHFPAGTGMIINKHWILTLAEILFVYKEKDIQVFVGTNSAGRTGQRTNVSKIIKHEKYNGVYILANNIALLKTETPLIFGDTVKPVRLGSSVPIAGTHCSLLGYGYLQEKPFAGYDLGVATVQVKSRHLCKKEYDEPITGFCAEADGVVPCYNDYGDPLIYKNKLVGFFIGGDFCNKFNRSEVYTNVPSFKKWIWKTIKENSNDEEKEGLLEYEFYED